MIMIDAPLLMGFAAILSGLASLVWAVRRSPK